MDRRDFFRSAGLLSAASLIDPERVLAAPQQAGQHFDLHPFVGAHPEAVFIRATAVAQKTDDAAKQQEGLAFARELFTRSGAGGIPLTGCTRGTWRPGSRAGTDRDGPGTAAGAWRAGRKRPWTTWRLRPPACVSSRASTAATATASREDPAPRATPRTS